MTAINDIVTAGQYFLVITVELVILFIGISFLVGLIREYVPEEKIRNILTSKHRGVGNIFGAFFGSLTPFCSCSTIPILVGLLDVGVPFGIAYSFLIASPLLNPVIFFLLLALFGLVPTLIYAAITFSIAVISGILIERAGYARYVKAVTLEKSCCCECSGEPSSETSVHKTRFANSLTFAFTLFRQVVPYLILGAAIGAFIYGFIPEELIVAVAGPDNPLAIPVAAVIGVPMYIRAETIIPISAVLLEKGMGIGAIMALIIGGAGASIPEVTLLASIFERRLVAAFVVTVLGVAILAGVLFQILASEGIILT
ncbi:MAG TPA: permease [Methanospirillum sp.]|uniref:permease n=3 Tax=Methanospirillum sp. TaxID=45200 RepID=UPI002C614D56|nr:permease [Methanospirillum sp.]HOJ95852.1 permease [Methanospirillum sp.]HOL40464.1 permease [Methanospirillum sp.]